MPVDDTILFAAQRFDRGAMEKLLESEYAPVHRMAHGLAGREDVGRGIVRFVMTQSLRRMKQWRDGEAAERWFHHHTVLTARRAAQHQPKAQEDVLVTRAEGNEPAYVAFVRGLRTLPFQQREAFILHHGERFTIRQMAVAMDCSTKAAEMHLQAAQTAIRPIAGDLFPVFVDRVTKAYGSLTATEDLVRPTIRGYVQHSLWPRRIRRIIKLIFTLAVLAAIAWAVVRYRAHIPWDRLRGK